MAVTIQQIAEKAGVSRGTVDRALNHRGRIDPDVARRIIELADEMGYVTKSRRNREKKTYRIGVVTQLAKYSFMHEMNAGIETAKRELANRNVEILLEEGLSVDEQEQLGLIDRLTEQGIDALAVMPVSSDGVRRRINELTEQRGIPVATFNSDITGTKRLAFVGMDNRKSGQTAAGLMATLMRGVGKVLIITGYFGNQVCNARVDGFVSEIKRTYPEIEITGVQSGFDDAKEVENIVVSAMLGTQTITGILIVSAGQSGLDRAFARLKLDQRPYIISYDLTPWSREALADDKIDFLIDQDCFTQGYQSLWTLANYLMNDERPQTEHLRTDISIKTKYNI